MPFKTVARTFGSAGSLVVGIVLLSGCDLDGYSENLRFPVRSDPLVTAEAPVNQPLQYDRPGTLLPLALNLGDPAHPEHARRDRFLLDPAKLTDPQRRQLETALTKRFGTPAHPRVELEGAVAELKLDAATLANGSTLYRRHCLHCHGLTGDGRGPTAPWVNPHPRDYRQGIFKFTSSEQDAGVRKARRYDLLRTMRDGIEGTSMPSFRLLPEDELEALASYVIHLSLRGETEKEVIREVLDGETAIEAKSDEYAQAFLERWQNAQNSVIKPGEYRFTTPEQRAASVKRGFKRFREAGEAGCISCHQDYGRQPSYRYDAWGTIVQPTNLTTGIYRGGHRPVDFYWRIHSGVNGAGMPAFKSLKPDEIWDLVNFVQVLPYPKMRKEYGIEID